MDPLTHALLGGSAARVALARPLGRAAWLPGIVGALLPDADTIIRSASDPLLYAEYHRHFTHALAFVPLGGLLAALPWLVRPDTRARRLAVLGAATLGYATHGLLDATTTYGTLLFWPFSDARIGLSWISIIDPLFTLALLLGVLLAVWRGSARPVAGALLVCCAYLALGALQQARALDAQAEIARARGHLLARGGTFPTFANQVVWRSLYQAGDSLYFDRIRIPWLGGATWAPVSAHRTLAERDLPAEVLADERLRTDFQRFSWFAADWLALDPGDPSVIGDARYSARDDGFVPVWGVRLRPSPAEPPTEWIDRSRSRELDLGALLREITRGGDGYQPVVPERAP